MAGKVNFKNTWAHNTFGKTESNSIQMFCSPVKDGFQVNMVTRILGDYMRSTHIGFQYITRQSL